MPFKKTKSKIWIYLFISLLIIILFVAIKNLFLNNSPLCNEFSDDYKSTCLKMYALKSAANDFEEAWKICKQIDQNLLRDECYNDIIIEIGKEKPEEIKKYCNEINSEKWRGECYFNMALFLTKINITKAFAICNKAEIYVPFCYHDVAGEASLINTTKALNICEKQVDNLTKRTCFHGIGKYLGRNKPDKAIIYCNQIEDKGYKESCYHGLGWGMAEIDMGNMDYARSNCEGIESELKNNCFIGVAWKLSKNDKEKAKEVCNNIKNEQIKKECLNFPR